MSKKSEDVEIGSRIRSIRNSLDLDQKEFASKIGSTVSALSNWENGRNKPKSKIAERIAELGNMSVSQLMGGSLEEYAKEILLNNIILKGSLYDLVIEYLIVSSDLGKFMDGVLLNDDGSFMDQMKAFQIIEETKNEAALEFVVDNLDNILERIAFLIDGEFLGKDDTIIEAALSYVKELSLIQAFTFEGYYRKLSHSLEILFPTVMGKIDIDLLTEIHIKEGLSNKEARKKAIAAFYQAKMGEVQVDAIIKINDIWKEYQQKLEEIE